jgi:hypothetical protein
MAWCGDDDDARKRTPRDHAFARPDRRFADLTSRQSGSEAGRSAGRQVRRLYPSDGATVLATCVETTLNRGLLSASCDAMIGMLGK